MKNTVATPIPALLLQNGMTLTSPGGIADFSDLQRVAELIGQKNGEECRIDEISCNSASPTPAPDEVFIHLRFPRKHNIQLRVSQSQVIYITDVGGI